ncbi:MAG TPA: DUF342 domain-containing protein [Clostridiales bacterium]|nr:DUF342 domain-containing protein [Clostridiales bacterium]
MNSNTITLQGKDLEKLIMEAEKYFNTTRDNINIEVIEEKKTLFSKYYKINAAIKFVPELDKMEKLLNSLEGDLKVSEKSRVNIVQDENEREVEKVDSKYEITVDKEGMEAYLTVYPPISGGKEINKEDILAALEEKKIKSGILYEDIDKIVDEKKYNIRILIAKGKPAVHGKDARVEYNINIVKEKKIRITEDGKVDYKDLSLINNVDEGELLATIIPATEGVNGEDIYGNVIKAKDGKKIAIPKGRNVIVSEDGLKLISAIKGEVKIIDNKINVFPVHTIEGNVDNSTGNIKFLGKVVVKGNVLTGFTIEADEDVEVYGVVEGARIISKGNIILHRGIQGVNKGELTCEGDLIAKFIENSKVYAKGNIQSEAIMHSIVYCGKKLEVLGKKGLIVGGEIKASDEIKAKTIGSPMATITAVEVGINPDIRKKYDELLKEKNRYNENLEKLSKAVDLLTKFNQKGELTEDKKELLNRSIVLKLQTQKALEDITNEIEEIAAYIEDISNGKIKVENVVYPGTRITIGTNCMYIRDQIQYATFYRVSGEIKVGSYEP